MQQRIRAITVAAALLCLVFYAKAATEITWWHSMSGALGERVAALADKFNKSQSEYKVNAVFKGAYDESMSAAIAAHRAGNAPNILQVFEVGTATMMYSKGAISKGSSKRQVVRIPRARSCRSAR